MKLENQNKKPLKGKRRQTTLPRKEVQGGKTKNTEEKINSHPIATKKATRSSNRLKLVPDKLKKYFTEHDEEYFNSQETDDVFVSG